MSPWMDYYDKTRTPGYLSWPVIILAMAFWPVGLVLLIARIARDRHAGISTGRLLRVVGVLLSVVCLILIIVGYTDEMDRYGSLEDFSEEGLIGLGVLAAFEILGIILWRFGNKLVYRGGMVREYLDVVVNKRFFGLSEVARIVGKPETTVQKELTFMIKTGFLPDAYIDENNRIIVPSVTRQMAYEEENRSRKNADADFDTQPAKAATGEGPVLVTCRSCGANNMFIPSRPSRCEFCGSPLRR